MSTKQFNSYPIYLNTPFPTVIIILLCDIIIYIFHVTSQCGKFFVFTHNIITMVLFYNHWVGISTYLYIHKYKYIFLTPLTVSLRFWLRLRHGELCITWLQSTGWPRNAFLIPIYIIYYKLYKIYYRSFSNKW